MGYENQDTGVSQNDRDHTPYGGGEGVQANTSNKTSPFHPPSSKPPKGDLLPCPFCGGPAELHERDGDVFVFRWSVRCEGEACGAGTDSHPEQSEAIAIWNSRPLPGTRSPVDLLQAEADRIDAMDPNNLRVMLRWAYRVSAAWLEAKGDPAMLKRYVMLDERGEEVLP